VLMPLGLIAAQWNPIMDGLAKTTAQLPWAGHIWA
jgi:hypothetical protein